MKLNTLSHHTKALHSGITGAIAGIAWRALSDAFAWLRRRRQRRNAVERLADLNERLLVDIDLPPREQLRRAARDRRERQRAEIWRFL
jgi:hypothetical protein